MPNGICVIEIEAAEYNIFQEKFKNNNYAGLRYGQAFYNHFNLHKMADTVMDKLYELDGDAAVVYISEHFNIR